MKSIWIRDFYRIWTEYEDRVRPRIHSECGVVRVRRTPNANTFHAVDARKLLRYCSIIVLQICSYKVIEWLWKHKSCSSNSCYFASLIPRYIYIYIYIFALFLPLNTLLESVDNLNNYKCIFIYIYIYIYICIYIYAYAYIYIYIYIYKYVFLYIHSIQMTHLARTHFRNNHSKY